MRSHLSFKHPGISLTKDSKPSNFLGSKQTTLTSFTKRATPLAEAHQQAITKKIAIMCALDLKPLSLVEGNGFKHFVHALNPQYRVPCRKTVSKYLDVIYEEEKSKLIEKIGGQSVSVTSDLWTSNAMQAYITVTSHFITPDWKLNSYVLATRMTEERHTGSNIATEVESILREFNVANVTSLVTDNASNMVIAAKELKLPHINCFAHTLQLVIEDGLKIGQISKTLGAARKLVSHFSHSVLSINALIAKQDGNLKLKLVQDVPTRWNSSFLMMQRLLKLRVPIYGIIFDDNLTKPSDRLKLDLKDSFWKIMEEICPILEPLAQVTEVLGAANSPTGSSVFVLLSNLVGNILKEIQTDSNVVKEMKSKIRAGLQKRFKIDENGLPREEVLKSPLILACIFDPRYKALLGRDILSPDQLSVVHKEVLSLMQNITPQSNVTVKEEAADEAPSPKKLKISDIIKGDCLDLQKGYVIPKEKELKEYLEEPIRVACPLQWWQQCESKFPRVSKLARQFLPVQATSIPSERTFSTAGQTVTKLRSALEPDTVDKIIFLNRNSKSTLSNFQPTPSNSDAKMSTKSEHENPKDLDKVLSNAVATEVKQESDPDIPSSLFD